MGVGLVAPALGQDAAGRQGVTGSPNILLIVVDDQARSLFSRELMPSVFDRIVDRGVKFDRAYVNTSKCCPSRAQILTGLYGHHTKVDGNAVGLWHPSFVEMLKDRGYRTAIAGKYLNSWPCARREEFDLWACIRGSTEHASLRDPTLTVNGVKRTYRGYQSEILANLLSNFIAGTPDDKPFFAMYTTTSPHMPADDTRYRSLQVRPYRPPSFDEDTTASGKPVYLQRSAYTRAEIRRIDQVHRKMTRATRALDDSIGRLLDGLGDRAQNTLVFYISDNGYLYGEHRLTKKVVPYEESVNVPFAIRFPELGGPQGVTSRALVQNVDIAPTVADLVGAEWGADGYSLLPLLADSESSVRDAALIETCQGHNYPCPGTEARGARKVPSFWGIVTERYKYVELYTGETELYDLFTDPYELVNLASDPQSASTRAQLAVQLQSMRQDPTPETTIVSGSPDQQELRRVWFRYFTQDKDDRYRCRWYSESSAPGLWEGCPSFTASFVPPTRGTYVFEVAAYRNGYMDPTPASRTFTVESP